MSKVDYLLVLDSSGESASVALFEAADGIGARLLEARSSDPVSKHAQTLLPLVDEVLRSRALRTSDLAGIYVCVGPGSFTGVRVAVATAKGLAQPHGIPLYGVHSGLLHRSAYGPRSEGDALLASVRPAGRGEVYVTVFDREEQVAESGLMKQHELTQRAASSGWRMLSEPETPLHARHLFDIEHRRTRAADDFGAIRETDARTLTPLYYRQSQAEESCAAQADTAMTAPVDMATPGSAADPLATPAPVAGSLSGDQAANEAPAPAGAIEQDAEQGAEQVAEQDAERRSVRLEVRRATPDDVDGIYGVELSSFPTPWNRDSFVEELTKNRLAAYFVATIEGLVVGFAGCWTVVDEIHITNVAVLPDFRRLGIGRHLMEALFDFARRGRFLRMTLEARVSNHAAIALYESLGFVSAGIRPRYYVDTGEDALILWKELGRVTLGIETSCDETSCAVLSGERDVRANVIHSQIDLHKRYGGVVPELASRNHLDKIQEVVDEALEQAGIDYASIDQVAVTSGPGLVGALLVGLSYGKALAYSLSIPFVGVHHIEGHIAANYLAHPTLKPPFLCLVVSGGHTHLIDVRGYDDYVVLGKTRDDAVGEAFDKVARTMKLGYPGGPIIDRLAREGSPVIDFPRAMLEKDSLDFSFSGLKSAVLNYLNQAKQNGIEVSPADVAASFQIAVVDVLTAKTKMALEQTGYRTLALAGGVAANTAIRASLAALPGITLYVPPVALCTDNAAMIAAAGIHSLAEGRASDLSLNAVPNAPIGSFHAKKLPMECHE